MGLRTLCNSISICHTRARPQPFYKCAAVFRADSISHERISSAAQRMKTVSVWKTTEISYPTRFRQKGYQVSIGAQSSLITPGPE